MGKWLAIAGAALLVILLVLWKQLDSTSATAAPVTKPTAALAAPALPTGASLPAPDAAIAAVDDPKPEKLDPQSDAFFYKFDEVVPANLTREAAKCYEGRQGKLHRNQKMRLKFKTRIRNGVVTVHDVKVDETTIGDTALEACFLQSIQRVTWTDAELPDWDQDDQLIIRPERGMKKYMRDNVEYVGAPAPKD